LEYDKNITGEAPRHVMSTWNGFINKENRRKSSTLVSR